jgi:hypothetical protein
MVLIAADYPFLDVFWTMIIFFAWVVWIWMMVLLLSDLFRRRDVGGWTKAAWCVFMIVLPFLGVLTYLIAQHDGIAQRNSERAAEVQQEFDARVRAAVTQGGGHGNGAGAAAEIEKAEQLLARGTISPSEFEALKAHALAHS